MTHGSWTPPALVRAKRGAHRDAFLMMSGCLKFCNVLALSAPQTTISA